MTITVIGAGYVGLVTAAIFSDFGNKVYCVDIDKQKIAHLKKGQVPFFEPSLEDYIKRNLQNGHLIFTTSYHQAVPKSQVVLICVGTPSRNSGEADLTYLFRAVEETAKNLSGYTLITIKSTIPIGFEDDLVATVKKYAKANFEFAVCPEFLREGTAIEDSLHPDRIVIGTTSKRAQKILLELHTPISGQRIITDMRSAQLIKYTANALLATKVSFANAVAILCEKMGADVKMVMDGVGADKRIGRSFLYPGVGYGGSCLPKDVTAFIAIANHFNYNFDLLRAVDAINNSQIEAFVNKVLMATRVHKSPQKNLTGKTLAVWGLSFKPNTDDMRDAPSVKIINHLKDLGANITAFDPVAMENARRLLPGIEYAKDPLTAIKNKDALLLITDWPQFSQFDLASIKKQLKKPIIVDGRNFFDKAEAQALGFTYIGVGR